MDSLLYVYVPVVAAAEVRALLQVLQDSGYSISHLGKNDPPKKWSGSLEQAETIVLSGNDPTLYTHIKDTKRKLDMTIVIQRDPRWKHSTISISLPTEESLRSLGVTIADQIRSFAAILGSSGAGKDQVWEVLRLSEDCPPELSAKLSKGMPNQSAHPMLAKGQLG